MRYEPARFVGLSGEAALLIATFKASMAAWISSTVADGLSNTALAAERSMPLLSASSAMDFSSVLAARTAYSAGVTNAHWQADG